MKMPPPMMPLTRPQGGDLLAIAFVTVVTMWIVGYITHIPVIESPPAAFLGLIAALVGGGFLCGKYTTRTRQSAIMLGMLTATINLLIVGSLLSELGPDDPSPLLVVPGYYLATVAIMMIGDALGRRRRTPESVKNHWGGMFAVAMLAATALVVKAGGLVTGFDAGFAVPDWPNTFGTNMFLYPLSRMTGGIYYEHTHRLAGTLVGVTAIAFVIWCWVSRQPRRLSITATVALVLVCIQGVAGGIWVTDVIAEPGDTDAPIYTAIPKVIYILFHGTTGQAILGLMAIVAAMATARWQRQDDHAPQPQARLDRTLGILLVVALLIQLVLGVAVRKHVGNLLLLHITMATIVTTLAIAVGIRGLDKVQFPVLRRFGLALLILVCLQMMLGVGALVFRTVPEADHVVVGSEAVGTLSDAIFTTLHQTTGAALLAVAMTAMAWNFRLLKPMPNPQPTQTNRDSVTSAEPA